MFGSECDLKMHVQNFGYPFPTNQASKPPIFDGFATFNGNFDGECLRNETRHKQSGTALEATKGFYTV